MKNKDIISINDIINLKIDYIENNINNKKLYCRIIKKIQNDINYIEILETLYLDAYLLLNFKNKINLITEEEKKFLFKLRLILTQDFTLFLLFQNDENFRYNIINQSSNYKKYNILTKSKMYYSLDESDKIILSKINYKVLNRLNKFDLTLYNIKQYILNSNEDFTIILNQIIDYLHFIYFNNSVKYKKLKYGIRRINGKINNDDLELSTDEISDFILSIAKKHNKIKIYNLYKKGD